MDFPNAASEVTPADAATDGHEPFAALRYLIAERSELYCGVIEVFTAAKAEFRLHLRPTDIWPRLPQMGVNATEEEMSAALDQLVEWGNLQAYHDSADVATIADFQRRKLLYQLTAAGEAAQRAAANFLQLLSRPMALEAEALLRIRENLAELAQLCSETVYDTGKLAAVLRTIAADAEQLTAQAQSFFRWLHEQTAHRGADLASFLRYKEKLIDYLQRFLAELAAQSGQIATLIDHLQPSSARFLQLVTEQEAAAAFARDDAERQTLIASAHARWQQRWRGLRLWFVGLEGDPQVKQLRSAAGAAIPRLLAIAAQLHDQRASRSDRRADMLELAVWMLEADDDRQAHRLWSSAFAAGSVRHLYVDAQTLDERQQRPVPAQRSWLDAPPISIAPQLRKTGRAPAAAPARRIVDLTAQRRELRRRRDNEQQRLSLARGALIQLGPRRLAEVGSLEPETLMLLLELLDRVAAQRARGEQGTALSEDGSLRIVIDWNVPAAIVTIETPAGSLHTSDAFIQVMAAETE